MKYQYKEMPESMRGTYGEFAKNFGFDWKEFIMGIPTPMFLVTTFLVLFLSACALTGL